MNRRVARAVSPNVVAQYQNDLALAQLRQQAALEVNRIRLPCGSRWLNRIGSPHMPTGRALCAANQKQQGTVNQLDVERLRLQSEMYRLGLRRGEALVNESHEAQLEWRLSMLGD